MSSAKCAICTKTAYPLESVKALDKTYHKLCFKCSTCGITLNLKNFVGKEGLIYCKPHTPVERSSTTAQSVAVKSALTAPKKKAEGLAQVQKGTAVYAADGPVVRSSDPTPAAQDQSVEVEARSAHVQAVNDGPAVTFEHLGGAPVAAEPQAEEEAYEPEYQEEAQYDDGQYQEEAQYEEGQYQEEAQYDEGY